MRRFDLALFLELNEAYRSRPLVPAPRSNDPSVLASRGRTRARRLVDRFDLNGKSVLEIGCGRGEVAGALAAEHACRVVAIDIQSRPEWAESKSVDFLVADLSDRAPSELGEFDFIFASSVWEHVRHPYTMLEQTRKLLAPRGVFQLSANLYRGPRASHRYREVFFPWPHLLFEDDVFEDFYRHIGMEPARSAWVNYLTATQYQRYFDLLEFSVQKLEYSITPLDREFYRRFEDRLSRYPIFDLERDFIHVVLTHRRPGDSAPRPAADAQDPGETTGQPERDRIGAAYLGSWGSEVTQQRARARIKWMAASARGPRILDIGCSEGILTVLLARAGHDVVGVDIDPAAITAAKELLKTVPTAVRGHVDLRVADALTADLGESGFDTVVLGEVIEHLTDPAVMLERAADLLRPGGRLVLTTPFGHFPHPDHRQEFRTTQLAGLLSKRFVVGELSVVDGYFRVSARLRSVPLLEEQRARERRVPSLHRLLVATEEGAIASQRDLHCHLDRLHRQLTRRKDQVTELDRLKSEVAQLNGLLTAAEESAAASRKQMQSKLKVLSRQLKASKEKQDAFTHKIRHLDLQLEQTRLRLKQNEKGLHSELGRAVEKSLRSPVGVFRLPLRIAKTYRRARKRAEVEALAPFPLRPCAGGDTADPPAISPQRKRQAPERILPHRDISSAFPPYPFPARAPRSSARVATILDEFSDACFRYEADLVRLTKEDWRAEIERERPEILFVESAWRGNRENWRGLIQSADDTLDNPLEALVEYCKRRGIPTVFWNKEDPPNFEHFIDAAAKFDHVFTTDANCIARYQARLGHQRVGALPFAAQPAIHNPIGKVESDDFEVAFAGTWYVQKHDQRGALLPIVLDAAMHRNLHIFDRMSGYTGNHYYQFPESYAPFLRVALAYPNILSAYRSFKVFLNVNSVIASPTMFARRVFEILASETAVVSTASAGISQMLGDAVSLVHDKEEAQAELDRLLDDETYRQRKAHLGYRKVLEQHTYAARFHTVVDALGLGVVAVPAAPAVSVVVALDDERWLENALANVRRQRYPIRPVWIVKDGAAGAVAQRVMSACPGATILEVEADASLLGMLGRGIEAAESALIAALDPRDFYGPEFIGDLVLASSYAEAEVVGKAAYFSASAGGEPLVLHEPALRNRHVDRLLGTAWLARQEFVRGSRIDQMLSIEDDCPVLVRGPGVDNMYSADPYNYVRMQGAGTTPEAHTAKLHELDKHGSVEIIT